jgi:hypothetical protein
MLLKLETADIENTSPIKYIGVGESAVFITNNRAQKCLRNFANGNFENTIVGSVPVDAHSATLTSQSNFVQTVIAETAVMTILSVFRPKAGASFAASNYTNTPNVGVGLWVDGSGFLSFFASRDGGDGPPLTGTAKINGAVTYGNWILASGVTSGSGNTVNNHTAGTTSTAASTATRMLQANAIRLGSSWGGTFTGAADHLITVIVPAALSAAQIASAVADLRAYAAKHDIAV